MALKVGIYDEPQVRAQAAPNVGLSSGVPNFGAALGQGVSDVATVMKEQVDATTRARLQNFQSDASVFTTQLIVEAKDKGLNNPASLLKPGPNGENPLESYGKRYQDFADAALKDAEGNPQLTALIKAHGLQMGTHLTESIMGVQLAADEKYKDSAKTTAYEVPFTNVKQLPTDQKTYDLNLEALKTAVGNLTLGLPPETAQEKLMVAESALFGTRLTELLKTPGGVPLAKKLFDENAAQKSPLMVDPTIAQHIAKIGAEEQAVSLADEAEAASPDDSAAQHQYLTDLKRKGTIPALTLLDARKELDYRTSVKANNTTLAVRKDFTPVASIFMKNQSGYATMRTPEWKAFELKHPVEAIEKLKEFTMWDKRNEELDLTDMAARMVKMTQFMFGDPGDPKKGIPPTKKFEDMTQPEKESALTAVGKQFATHLGNFYIQRTADNEKFREMPLKKEEVVAAGIAVPGTFDDPDNPTKEEIAAVTNTLLPANTLFARPGARFTPAERQSHLIQLLQKTEGTKKPWYQFGFGAGDKEPIGKIVGQMPNAFRNSTAVVGGKKISDLEPDELAMLWVDLVKKGAVDPATGKLMPAKATTPKYQGAK